MSTRILFVLRTVATIAGIAGCLQVITATTVMALEQTVESIVMVAPVDGAQAILLIDHDCEFAEGSGDAVDAQVKHIWHVRPL